MKQVPVPVFPRVIIHLERSRKKRSLDTIKWRKVQSDKIFQKIMLAVMPVKSGLRSYGGLQNAQNEGKSGFLIVK